MKIKQKISTKFFIISHISILIAAILFLGWLYYVLYLGHQPPTMSQLGEKLFTQKPKTILIDLDQPDEDSLVYDPSILISGKTTPNTDILIMSDSEDLIVRSKADGNFSISLDLSEGVNKISALVFETNGEARLTERQIFYSKEKL